MAYASPTGKSERHKIRMATDAGYAAKVREGNRRRHARRYARNRLDPEWVARNRERRRRYGNPTPPAHVLAAKDANRQARRLGVMGRITPADVVALWERQPVCLSCGDDRGLDHIVAMGNGGTNAPSNLQNLCLVCNQAKHTRDLAPDQIDRPPFRGDAEFCRRLHPRSTSMRTSPSGHRYCVPCHAIYRSNSRPRKVVAA